MGAAALVLLPACGSGDKSGGRESGGRGGWGQDKREARPFPVATELPAPADVDAAVETQATLETDRRADVLAEIDGRVTKRLLDVGDTVPPASLPAAAAPNTNGNGPGVKPRPREPLDLAYLDARDRDLDVRDARIQLEEAAGRQRERTLERNRAQRELAQAGVELAEAEVMHKRTVDGLADGTISREEHINATFTRDRAKAKLHIAESALEEAELALELVAIETRKAELARDRAVLAREKTLIRAPFAGVVTLCNVRSGQRVRAGDLLYRIEDKKTLIVYGDLPVRQSARVAPGNPVAIGASAVTGTTTGEVVMVAPTVDGASGTVRVKIRVVPAPGFKPGLFVTLRIVVDTRAQALTVPKRAVLHDDEDGAYLFVASGETAQRVLVKTGYSRGDRIEILTGIETGSRVVVEGQDTLSDGAKIEDLALKKAGDGDVTDADDAAESGDDGAGASEKGQ